jgi:hypothetical protein
VERRWKELPTLVATTGTERNNASLLSDLTIAEFKAAVAAWREK